MNELSAIKVSGCNREDCPVNEGGACIEDVEHTEDCENAILTEPKPQDEFYTVDTGLGLSLEGVATMQQDREIPTASIIGASSSGKTTFLAMLFHRFIRTHEGFNNYLFMDSVTFLGLNQKLHYADIKSRNQSVNMPRTSLAEEPAFHFKTLNTAGDVCECLWIDVPGETMEQRLSKSVDGWQDNVGLARSTHVLLFLDLKIISDGVKRGAHVEQSFDSLTYSIQSKTWIKRKLMIVFSKADAFSDGATDHINTIQTKAMARFSDNFENIEFCELHSLGAEPDAGESLAKVWNWLHTA